MMTNDATPGQVASTDKLGPKVWARKDQLQHASTRGGLMCAMYPDTKGRADLEPLYDQTAIDAAVAAERERCAALLERGIDLAGLNTTPGWQKYTADLLNGCAAMIRGA
jgi:hypothetical protein